MLLMQMHLLLSCIQMQLLLYAFMPLVALREYSIIHNSKAIVTCPPLENFN